MSEDAAARSRVASPPGALVQVLSLRDLMFDDGRPVSAASGVAPLGDGHLVACDDATHAAWVTPRGVGAVRLFPPVSGHDRFSPADGTKQLKPDLEAAIAVRHGGADGVLLLGSGSTSVRTRAALVRLRDGEPDVVEADLASLYERARTALGARGLNFEGACVVGGSLRWFARGNRADGVPSAAVDVDLTGLLAAVAGDGDPTAVAVGAVHPYDLGDVAGVQLGVTDAVALPDGRLVLAAAAEATNDAVEDGAIAGSVLAIVAGDVVTSVVSVPPAADGTVWKVEGLALLAHRPGSVDLIAVTDADDEQAPSVQVIMRLATD